jgi:hypothetical protein
VAKVEEKYIWTAHAHNKMQFYRLSESRVKRIIRHPERIEEAIVPGLVAVMQPAGTTKYSEIWAMYKVLASDGGKLKVITAWRYPGESPERDPIPESVIKEVRSIVGV